MREQLENTDASATREAYILIAVGYIVLGVAGLLWGLIASAVPTLNYIGTPIAALLSVLALAAGADGGSGASDSDQALMFGLAVLGLIIFWGAFFFTF